MVRNRILHILNLSLTEPISHAQQTDAILAAISEGCVPVYQLQRPDGSWWDNTEKQSEYNAKHANVTRILYTSPVVSSDPQQPDDRDALIAELQAKAVEYRAIMDNLYKTQDELRARLAAVEKDAARWEEVTCNPDFSLAIWGGGDWVVAPDAEIIKKLDSAIAAGKEKQP